MWSDKIRSFSTWAGIAGLGINLVVFLTAIALVEPWKRRKMAEGIERRMGRMMEVVEARIEGLREQVAAQAQALPVPSMAALPEGGPLEPAPDLAVAEITMEPLDPTPDSWAAMGRAPLLQTVLPDLPPRLAVLSPITVPSHDRDLAVAATAGIAVGALLVGAAHLFRS